MWDSLSRKDEASKTLARYKWLMLSKKLNFSGGYFSGVSNA